jgi:glycosyltransferase involved in cell wall biosynthesis
LNKIQPKEKVLIVGAFPHPKTKIFGGFLTVCNALKSSSFSKDFDLLFVDTTQISNPAPGLLIRSLLASKRLVNFFFKVVVCRPHAAIIFCSSGLSLLEKGIMGRFTSICAIPTIMAPGGGHLLKDFDRSFALRLFARIAFLKADKILCQGQEWQQFLSTHFSRDLEDLPIVGNWTATKELLQIGQSRSYRPKVGKLKLLFVGWLDLTKGVMDLLEAIQSSEVSNRFHLEFVGEGNVSEKARNLVSEKNLGNSVTFKGWLHGEDLKLAYQNADVFILPSWMEGLPNAMIEAMSAGLCVVVSSVGNIPSTIQNQENGILISAQNPSSIIDALVSLLENDQRRIEMGKKACNFAAQNFSTEMAVGKLRKVVTEVVH